MKEVTKFSRFSSFLLLIVTLVLAIITFFYLQETRKIRKVAEESLAIENSPQVFLENIEFEPHLNKSNRNIEIIAIFKIKNAGKTKATEFEASYTFSVGNLNQTDNTEMPFLFPTQGIQFRTKMINVSLNEADFDIVSEAAEKKLILQVSKELVPLVHLDLNLKYIDHLGVEKNIPYKISYTFHSNSWGFVTKE